MKKEKFSYSKDNLKRLAVYLAAAGGVIGITGTLNATVHYNGIQNIDVNSNHDFVRIDLNNDGQYDFYFSWDTWHSTNTYSYVLFFPFNSNEIVVTNRTFTPPHGGGATSIYIPKRFSQSFILSSNISTSWKTISGTLVTNGPYPDSFHNQTGYIGVRFHSDNCQGNSWNYGWIQFEGIADSSGVRGRIIDWAYEDECDKPIKTGDKGEPVSVPLMGGAGVAGLGALLGAAGLSALRRKKEKEEE